MHERRLAGTARAHDCGELAALEENVDSVERANLAVAGAVDLGRAFSARGLVGVCSGAAGRGECCHAVRLVVQRLLLRTNVQTESLLELVVIRVVVLVFVERHPCVLRGLFPRRQR